MPENFIKIYQFTLVSGASEQEFVTANALLDTFLKAQEGFMYRSLSKQTDSLWQDIIYWDNENLGQKADEAFKQAEMCGMFMALIDESSVIVTESTVVTSLCGEEAGCEKSEELA